MLPSLIGGDEEDRSTALRPTRTRAFQQSTGLSESALQTALFDPLLTVAKLKKAAPLVLPSLIGGDEEDRTLDLTDANRTLSQLSYAPIQKRLSSPLLLFYSIQYFLSSVLKRIAEKIFSFSIFSLPARSASVRATLSILS